MRITLNKELLKMMKKDKKIVLILGGVGNFQEIEKQFPDRYIDIGPSEQSLIGVAAGMALQGMKPYVFGITPYIIERPFEQVKLDIDVMNTNVKLFGYGIYPHDGITHETPYLKDLMKVFTNIKSFYPKTKEEFINILKTTQNKKGPIFVDLVNV